ncbi:MAG: ABC transporter ATP-binding protein [Chlorobi bacterium]|nr:ABC transporter ATP-binding protein [Chlorobiota bacterium]
MIKTRNITKSYGTLQVLKGIDFDVERGEIVSILGASGAGKTTFLQILGTLDLPDDGEILYNEVNIRTLKEQKLSRFRNREIGFVFQFHHLLPEFTALENVCIPAFIAGVPRPKAEQKALELFSILNLSGRTEHKPTQLSGGEQQRVAVARALINDPAVLLADEPSGNLDSDNKNELHQLLLRLNRERNQTIVIVTHDKELAGIAHRQLTMKDGKFLSG